MGSPFPFILFTVAFTHFPIFSDSNAFSHGTTSGWRHSVYPLSLDGSLGSES